MTITRTIHHGNYYDVQSAATVADLPPTTYDTREPQEIADALANGEREHGWVKYDVEDENLTAFLDAYRVATLWANAYLEPESPDDEPEQLGIENYQDDAVMAQVPTDDAEDFYLANRARLEATGGTWDQHGHDFALTRNHHGAGFWDRGYPQELGERLTQAAQAYGEVHHDLAKDGTLYTD